MYNLQVQLHKCNCKLICKKISLTSTAWKVSKYGVFSDPYFPVCGLYAEIYSVNLCILSKYEKIRVGHFQQVGQLRIRPLLTQWWLFLLLIWSTELALFRSSLSEMFLGKGVLKIYSKFTGEHPCRSNFIEIAFRHRCSPVNLLHNFRTPFYKNTSGWLLLKVLLEMKVLKFFYPCRLHFFFKIWIAKKNLLWKPKHVNNLSQFYF